MGIETAAGVEHSGRRSAGALGMHRPSYGVVIVGRGAVAIPLPMAKLGCGGWL